jgi:hypothetical protein
MFVALIFLVAGFQFFGATFVATDILLDRRAEY